MTNAEKYLKDEIIAKDFISDYIDYCKRKKQDSVNLESLSLFLREEAKPTLTEDERVILRNIRKKTNIIGRNKNNMLYIGNYTSNYGMNTIFIDVFENLFQFIKERRRIRDRGVVKMILSKKITENMSQVFLNFETREDFDNEFKAIIKSLLTEEKITPVDIFNNLFVSFVTCGKAEDFLELCKVTELIDLNELKEYLKEKGDE